MNARILRTCVCCVVVNAPTVVMASTQPMSGWPMKRRFPHQGYIDFMDNRLDPRTGTITGRVVLPNPDLLLAPGLFARVRILSGSKYKALLLPPEAVGSDLSQQFVFVVDDQNLVQYRKVTLGPIIDGLRVVRDGIQPADWVIVKGVQRAKTGAKVDPIKQSIPDAQPAQPPMPERTAQKPNGGR